MDTGYLHLVSNHFPILLTLAGIIVLLAGMVKNSSLTKSVAYLLLLIAVIGGIVAFYTGEPAEEAVEHLAGVSETAIHEHEEAAEFVLPLIFVLGALSLAGIIVENKLVKWGKAVSIITLLAAIAVLAIATRVGYLGGKIRHTEYNGVVNAAGNGEKEEGEKD